MAIYTLFSQTGGGALAGSDATAYTMGVQFTVSQSATLNAIWFYSAAGAAVLPQTILLYAVTGQALVHSETASWSGAAGSGWVRAAFSSPPALAASTAYKASVAQSTGQVWYSATSQYWSSGAGSGGITNGPLSAPNNATSAQGQDTFDTSVPAYPNTSFSAANYWVDPEVSVGANHNVTASLTVTPVFHVTRSQGHARHASLTVTPAFNVVGSVGRITSRAIVRAGIARYFGGAAYDQEARAYRGSGPLAAYGLSTVRAYTPKRESDEDYVIEQAAGRGMGAAMIVEIPHDKEYRTAKAGAHGGIKLQDYDVVLATFHLAHMDHAEDAEYDIDLLIEAIKDHIRADRTLDGICYQAGENDMGIEVIVEPSEEWHERLMTVFTVQFTAQVAIGPI